MLADDPLRLQVGIHRLLVNSGAKSDLKDMKKSKIGVWQSVFCATLALSPYVLAAVFSGSIEVLSKLIQEAGFEILSGLIALYSSAIILGGYAGSRIERNLKNNKSLCYLIGIGLAVSCLLAAILAGALASLLHEAVTDEPERAVAHAGLYLLYIPAYIMLYAVIPAAALGVLYTFLVTITVRRRQPAKIPNEILSEIEQR